MKKRLFESGIIDHIKTVKKVNYDSIAPRALFIFRRDLRLFDNTTLLLAAREYSISPVFIFSPEQVASNAYKSSNAVQFLVNSLLDLQYQIAREGGSLNVLYGKPLEVIKELCSANKVSAIFFNKDYTPYSLERDREIEEWATQNGISCTSMHDSLLIDDFESVKSASDTPYFLFTHFYGRAVKNAPRKCVFEKVEHWANLSCQSIPDFKKFLLSQDCYSENQEIYLKGGREEALVLLNEACKKLKDYAKTRHEPSKAGTSRLSAHNKFGTVSVREVYYSFKDAFGAECELNKQLYWRDFFYYVGHFHPKMYEGAPIPSKQHFSSIAWNNREDYFAKWCQGKTGFPLVDAGMREMNRTGHMHNRVRMVVAMFLTKDLIIDWRQGEKYFSQKLIDIDRAQNCGNWGWSAGIGPDGSPWLRIFNPWTQLSKIDPNAEYVRQWVPELKSVPVEDIMQWDEAWKKYPGVYCAPIVDHKKQRDLAYKAYGVKRTSKSLPEC